MYPSKRKNSELAPHSLVRYLLLSQSTLNWEGIAVLRNIPSLGGEQKKKGATTFVSESVSSIWKTSGMNGTCLMASIWPCLSSRKCQKLKRAQKVLCFVQTWREKTCSRSAKSWCMKTAAFQLWTDQKEGTREINPFGEGSKMATLAPVSTWKKKHIVSSKYECCTQEEVVTWCVSF